MGRSSQDTSPAAPVPAEAPAEPPVAQEEAGRNRTDFVASTANVGGVSIVEAAALGDGKWEQFVRDHPKGSIFHTPAMVQVFESAKRHRPIAMAAVDRSGEVLALVVSTVIQTLPGPLGVVSSRSIFYAEPLCRDDLLGQQALYRLMAAHDARVRWTVLFAEVRCLRAPGMEQPPLEAAGYEHMNHLNFIGDLTQPADALWKGLARQCRGSLRHAEKAGVTVSELTGPDTVEQTYPLLLASYEHAGVPMADPSLFASAIRVLGPSGELKVFGAFYEDRLVGADFVLLYKKTAYDWYRGTRRLRSVYAGESLVWHQMQWAKSSGYEIYDYGGAGWPNIPYGVRDFKAKFGGELVDYGRYRKTIAPRRMYVAEQVYELIRKARTEIQRRRGQGDKPVEDS